MFCHFANFSLKSDDTSSSTSLTESSSSNMNKPGVHHQTDKESSVRGTSTPRPLSLNTGKRGHVYVNLPVQLPVLGRNGIRTALQDTLPSSLDASAQLPASNQLDPSDPIRGSFPPPELDERAPGLFNQAELCETKCEQQDKFCWSPRCPPDGAAFYENSPPNSSISSSPTTKPIPDRKSIDSNDKRTQFPVEPVVISPPNTTAELKGFMFDKMSNTISSVGTTESHVISTQASSFPLPTVYTASGKLFHQQCRAHSEIESSNSTQVGFYSPSAFLNPSYVSMQTLGVEKH
ncbi:hypothetical protein P879_11608 [Paragonimus westermani]|uniref:Uncharacterized protein n=1 Tax=Paragonimus westermani TaxID=34504 RepID=A0A8T0D5R5_9TREM|nr:hypothetical protein P879_11608 [Paragonimus westermani]